MKNILHYNRIFIRYHTKKDLQYPTIICKICGRKFKSTSSKIYCSKNCEKKDKIKYIKKICLNCGNEYDCQRQESEWQEFCSEKCMHNYNGFTYTCINCGKIFISSINHSSLYCSYKCKHEFYLKKKIHKEICQQCGTEFYTVKAKFCSYACSTIFNNPINPNYFHGYFSKFGHYIRSGWEFNFVLILKYCNRKYKYEPDIFRFSDGTAYIPDFYDIKRNVYYEIKGRYFDIKEKLENMNNEYPSIKVKLIDKIKFIRIYKFFNKKIKLMDNKLIHKGNFLTKEEINSYR